MSKTGKALGFKKGDFVHTGMFPAIVIGEVHTFAPLCEVWGIEHEMGSAYATDLRKLDYAEWLPLAESYGFNGQTYSKVSQDALEGATV